MAQEENKELCKKCGEPRERKDGKLVRCKTCNRENVRRWQEKNPEKNRENVRRWREENPEKYRENVRRWREENPEKYREHVRRWQEKNPEKNREKVRRWREENPEKYRGYIKDYRAHKESTKYDDLIDESAYVKDPEGYVTKKPLGEVLEDEIIISREEWEEISGFSEYKKLTKENQ